jgi:hypothetical protein
MNRKLVPLLALTVAAGAAVATNARAQMSERAELSPTEAAPRDAVEITVGTGYTQGFGQVQKGSSNNINDVANGGIGVDVGVGYRFSPNVGVGVTGEYQEFSTSYTSGGTKSARGMLGSIDLTYHIVPFSKYDPFVRAGTGYRLLWNNADRTTLYHGFDLVRLAVGLDLKSSSDLAIAPVVGADLSTFLWQRVGSGTNSAIADPRVATYVWAGIQGRFDVGGHEQRSNMMTTARAY